MSTASGGGSASNKVTSWTITTSGTTTTWASPITWSTGTSVTNTTSFSYPRPCFQVMNVDITLRYDADPPQIQIRWSEKRWEPGVWHHHSQRLPYTNKKIYDTIREIMNERYGEILYRRSFDELLMEALL